MFFPLEKCVQKTKENTNFSSTLNFKMSLCQTHKLVCHIR